MTTRSGRPLWAEVDLDAIAHNIGLIRQRVAPAGVIAVVKANGYGHGAVAVGQAALAAGASQLAVACVDEGVQLRRAGIECDASADEVMRVFVPGDGAARRQRPGVPPYRIGRDKIRVP